MSKELDLLTGPPSSTGEIYISIPGEGILKSGEIDLIKKSNLREVPLYGGLGFVELIDMMPRVVPAGHTADFAIARNAWVSYARHINADTGEIDPKEVERIVRYLREHWHTSPSESVIFQFRARVPIFVSRHIDRHRTARANYESGRYIEMPEEFYLPNLRMQSQNNKQGSDKTVDVPAEAALIWNKCHADITELFVEYRKLLQLGVAKEVARTILPQSMMTSFMWQMDLNNLTKFLQLRLDQHAQQETREFAAGVLRLIAGLVPASMCAFEDFQLNQVSFNAAEQRYLRDPNDNFPNRKKNQLEEKLARISVVLNTN